MLHIFIFTYIYNLKKIRSTEFVFGISIEMKREYVSKCAYFSISRMLVRIYTRYIRTLFST